MSVENSLQTRSRTAAADLSAKQFYAVKMTSTGIDVATAAKTIVGVLQDKPASGKTGTIAVSGVTKAAISASQTISVGDLLEVDTGGTLIPHASGTIVAQALEALTSVAAVRLITVELIVPGTTLLPA